MYINSHSVWSSLVRYIVGSNPGLIKPKTTASVVSVLTSIDVDRGFDPQSSQIKVY